MAGGLGSGVSSLDDHRVQRGEKVWRLIDSRFYLSDPSIPNSKREVVEQAFSGDLSVLRQTKVNAKVVDAVYGGRFKGIGIVELSVDDLRKMGLVFEYEHDKEWGQDVHFLLRRVGMDGTTKQPKRQQLNPTQKRTLASIANSHSLLRVPP